MGGSEDVYVSDLSDLSEHFVKVKETQNLANLDLEILSDVRNSRGETIGILIGFVNISFITQLVFDIDERTIGNEYAYLVDDPGNILITADPEAKILAPHPDLNIHHLQEKLEGDENGYVIYVNSHGRKVISDYAYLGEYGAEKVGDWLLLSTAPYQDIMAPLYGLFYKVSIILLIVMTLTLFVGVLIIRMISRPIVKLKDAAMKIGSGKFITEIDRASKDEIGVLSEILLDMSSSLKQQTESLMIEKEKAEKLARECIKKNYKDCG